MTHLSRASLHCQKRTTSSPREIGRRPAQRTSHNVPCVHSAVTTASGYLHQGPTLKCRRTKHSSLKMVLHELGTNAVKHGALSNSAGRVDLKWEIIDEGTKQWLVLHWRERGGPPVSVPSRRGFGSQLIERALSAEQGSAELQFESTGLACPLEVGL